MSAVEVVLAFYVVLFAGSTYSFCRISKRALNGWDEALAGWKRANDRVRGLTK